MTLAQAIAAWKVENPPEWFVGQDYEAIAADRGQMWLERVQSDEAQAEEDARADAMKQRYQALKDGTATAKQTQEVVAHLLRQQYRDLDRPAEPVPAP